MCNLSNIIGCKTQCNTYGCILDLLTVCSSYATNQFIGLCF
ncbi:hypothetical protein LOK49_LG01G02152 [Camellia lanceoleosa]|uniref:Uncharacterized protein n=1 Tax=Camellia lanceoleosa TaxID=1840588 RepID=A0ACC0J6T1_9ERIC|nr:hypothetical protein LOK49_LG01G02152 [Camellia lanceoleosa]